MYNDSKSESYCVSKYGSYRDDIIKAFDEGAAYEKQRAEKLVEALIQIKKRQETFQTKIMDVDDVQEVACEALSAYESEE